jgi:hypothetical protein
MLTFGGHPVELRRVDTSTGPDVLVNCKNVTGLYSQAKAFVEQKNFITNEYRWGVKTTEPAYIKTMHNGDVAIACLVDTREQFNRLYNEARALL